MISPNTYAHIQAAISYMHDHLPQQLEPQDIAVALNLTPSHLEKLFMEWVGISIQEFWPLITQNYAKAQLQRPINPSHQTHSKLLDIKCMTTDELSNQRVRLEICYDFASSPLGDLMIATTHKGICYLCFMQQQNDALAALKQAFPKAQLTHQHTALQQQALAFFTNTTQCTEPLPLHLAATPFQLKVWQALLDVPLGSIVSYGNIALRINRPTAARAVGSAVGSNPVAFLIPCHRVIQQSGQWGGYRWGAQRKTALLGWEAAQLYCSARQNHSR